MSQRMRKTISSYFICLSLFCLLLLIVLPYMPHQAAFLTFFVLGDAKSGEIFLPALLFLALSSNLFNSKKLSLILAYIVLSIPILGVITSALNAVLDSENAVLQIINSVDKKIRIKREFIEVLTVSLIGISLVCLPKAQQGKRYLRSGVIAVMFAIDTIILVLIVEYYEIQQNFIFEKYLFYKAENGLVFFVAAIVLYAIYIQIIGRKSRNQSNVLNIGMLVTIIFLGVWGVLAIDEQRRIDQELENRAANIVMRLEEKVNDRYLLLEGLLSSAITPESLQKIKAGISIFPSHEFLPGADKVVLAVIDKKSGGESFFTVSSRDEKKIIDLKEKERLKQILEKARLLDDVFVTPHEKEKNNEIKAAYTVIPLPKTKKGGDLKPWAYVILTVDINHWINSNLYVDQDKYLKDIHVKIKLDGVILFDSGVVEKNAPSVIKSLKVNNSVYDVVVFASKEFSKNYRSYIPYLVLFIGILIATIIGILMRARTHSLTMNQFLNETLEIKTRDLARSKEQFQNIIDFCADGIITINDRGIITLFNKAAEWMFSYEAREVIGQNVSMLMLPDDAAMHDSYLKKSKTSYPDVLVLNKKRDLYGLKKTGERFPIRVSLSKIETDESYSFVGIITDISQEKKLQESLLQAKDQAEKSKKNAERLKLEAEKANKSKSEFLATMSHEIRTPMNGVIGMVDLLRMDSSLNEAQLRKVTVIRDSAFTLLRLIDDILDLSKIESGNMQIEQSLFSLTDTVSGVMDTVSANAKLKNVQLKYFIDKECPILLEGDAVRVRQVLLNLLSNAIKFSSPEGRKDNGRVTLWVSCIGQKDQQATIQFEVSDNGIGISEEGQKILFKPFTQAEQSTTRRFGGTGLGLAITQKLVNLMGGEISVESQIDIGSTFTVVITFVEGKSENKIECLDSEGDESECGSDWVIGFENAPRILLAEDNELNQEVVTEQLKSLNCAVTVADNGLIALDYWRENNYDLILSDCHMPEMDGYELAKAIRKAEKGTGKHTVIIAITANALKGESENCKAAGMDDYLSKPVELNKLKYILSQWLEPSLLGHVKAASTAKPKSHQGFDETVLPSIVGESSSTQSKFISKFLVQGDEIVRQMIDEFQSGNQAALAETAHKFKSSARSVGAIMVGDICEKIESLAKSNGCDHTVIEELREAYDSVAAYLMKRE